MFQRITPDVLTLPFYFNPTTLSPVANDGNRLILAAFADDYRFGEFRVAPVVPPTTLQYRITDATGTVLVDSTTDVVETDPIVVNGVIFTNLQALAGTASLTGQGKVVFTSSVAPMGPAANVNIFGIFSQAVGTFAASQILLGGTEVRR